MSTTVMVFAVIGLVSTVFLIATLTRQTVNRDALPMQYPVTTLSQQSVNWLYAIAVICAVVICAVLI